MRRLAASSEGDVTDLQARVSVCRACPRLVTGGARTSPAPVGAPRSPTQPYWGRPGPSFGDPDAEVLLVGLAPAANGTNRTGRMFTGDSSGDVLYAALHRTGFATLPTSVAAGDGQSLTGIRIVAAVRCAPPANKPTPAERETCSGVAASATSSWPPRGCGRSSASARSAGTRALAAAPRLGWDVPRPGPRFGHAAEVTLTTPEGRGIRLVGCYHVSPHNTFTGRLTPAMLDAVLLSLRPG